MTCAAGDRHNSTSRAKTHTYIGISSTLPYWIGVSKHKLFKIIKQANTLLESGRPLEKTNAHESARRPFYERLEIRKYEIRNVWNFSFFELNQLFDQNWAGGGREFYLGAFLFYQVCWDEKHPGQAEQKERMRFWDGKTYSDWIFHEAIITLFGTLAAKQAYNEEIIQHQPPFLFSPGAAPCFLGKNKNKSCWDFKTSATIIL